MNSQRRVAIGLLIPLLLPFAIAASSCTVAAIPSEPTKAQLASSAYPTPTQLSPSPTPTANQPPPSARSTATLPAMDPHTLRESVLTEDTYCRLPCFSGIMPGLSTSEDTKSLLSYLATWVFLPPASLRAYIAYMPPPAPFPPSPEIVVIAFSNALGLVDMIQTPRYRYPVQVLLAEYGAPDAVYLHILGILPYEQAGTYDLLLDYSTQGFIAVYQGPTDTGRELSICPQRLNSDLLGPDLWLFSPSEPSPLVLLDGRIRIGAEPSEFHPLSAIAGETPEQFHDTFSDPTSASTCMEIENPNPPPYE